MTDSDTKRESLQQISDFGQLQEALERVQFLENRIVEFWHDNRLGPLTLAEALGLSPQQYAVWVKGAAGEDAVSELIVCCVCGDLCNPEMIGAPERFSLCNECAPTVAACECNELYQVCPRCSPKAYGLEMRRRKVREEAQRVTARQDSTFRKLGDEGGTEPCTACGHPERLHRSNGCLDFDCSCQEMHR